MRRFVPLLGVVSATALAAAPALADPDATVDPRNPGTVLVSGELGLQGDDSAGFDGTASDGSDSFISYDDTECSGPERVFIEEYERDGADGRWVLIDAGCGDTATVPGRPVLTPDIVLEAVRRIGLPQSSVEAPPKTFVNYETTVYTVPTEFARTVTLLGFTVDVRAHPSQFAWHFGDGEVDYTDEPGAPYPADAITHTWEDAHRTFRPRVDTTYAVSYRVDGGPWLDLGETVPVTGPEGSVRIKEASPALS